MSEQNRPEYETRVRQARKISALVLTALNSPKSVLVPADLRAAAGELCALVIELARLSHAKFDMSPYDLPELTRRVESLEAFKGHLLRRENDG